MLSPCFGPQEHRQAEFADIKQKIIVCMEELEHVPDTTFEREVVGEEEDAFSLSKENIAALRDLLQQVREGPWPGGGGEVGLGPPLALCFSSPAAFLSSSCSKGERRRRLCAKSCAPKSWRSGIGCVCLRRKENPLCPAWPDPGATP